MKKECRTRGESYSSQGMIAFDDNSACLIHDSTYPPILHRLEYGPNYHLGINMDRGGFGERKDGSRYACLFDGTGGGGIHSLYAAQDLAEHMLRELSKAPLAFGDNPEHERGHVTELLTKCSFAEPTTAHGDATCVFVDIQASRVSGGALGDSGIIHIRQDRLQDCLQAHLFDTILKDDRTNITDTGGCIGRFGMIYRPDNICIISQEIAAGDFIVLASDGLLDNLARSEENEVLSLIVASPFFDLELEEMKQTPNLLPSHDVPGAEELQKMLKPYAAKNEPLSAVQIAKRLNHYIKFVTAKKVEAFVSILEDWEAVQSASAKETLGYKFKTAEQGLAGKCDDCLIIALQAV